MKKSVLKGIAIVAIMLSMSMNVMAAGSIVGAIDKPNTSATNEEGGSVNVSLTNVADNMYTDASVQEAVDSMNEAKVDTTVEMALKEVSSLDLSQIDKYEQGKVVEEKVALDVYKFLSPVMDLEVSGAVPTKEKPIKVKFVLTNMTDNIIVDILHYCDEHGWEVLAGTKISATEVEAEFHSASPIAIVYKEKASASTDTDKKSPQTSDVAVWPLLVGAMMLSVVGVFAMKKSRVVE